MPSAPQLKYTEVALIRLLIIIIIIVAIYWMLTVCLAPHWEREKQLFITRKIFTCSLYHLYISTYLHMCLKFSSSRSRPWEGDQGAQSLSEGAQGLSGKWPQQWRWLSGFRRTGRERSQCRCSGEDDRCGQLGSVCWGPHEDSIEHASELPVPRSEDAEEFSVHYPTKLTPWHFCPAHTQAEQGLWPKCHRCIHEESEVSVWEQWVPRGCGHSNDNVCHTI